MGRQIVSCGDLGVASFAASKCSAFGDEAWSSSPMDRAIDTATAEQRAVRRIHDRIDSKLCDVTLDNFDSHTCLSHKCAKSELTFMKKGCSGQPPHFATVLQWFLPTATINACSSLKQSVRSVGSSRAKACSTKAFRSRYFAVNGRMRCRSRMRRV